MTTHEFEDVEDGKQKYRLTFICNACGSSFTRITTNKDLKPRCSSCREIKAMNTPKLGDGAVSDADIAPAPPKDFRIKNKYRCDDCHETTYSPIGDPDPNQCVHCGSAHIRFYSTTAKGPISEHSRNQNKAIDLTADVTMHNYGMTDVKDEVIRGSEAPKIRSDLQEKADGLFAGSSLGKPKTMNQKLAQTQLARSIARVQSGQEVGPGVDVFKNLHEKQIKPQYDIIAKA